MEHIPVLLNQCLEALDIKPGGTYVDCTFGRGGHSSQILKRLDGGRLISLDRDMDAIEASASLKALYPDSFTAVHSEYSNLLAVLKELGIESVDGILFDLGVSSPQLDRSERGFSYTNDAPLDMRMDRTQYLTAADIVNEYSYDELKRILYDFGEERHAPLIAKAIVKRREQQRIETTVELARIIRGAMPAAALREKQHPAKRSFQAIRIAVNSELTLLQKGLDAAIEALAPGGRLAVISFHSLEDRIVKNTVKEACTGCTCPKSLPVCVCGKTPLMKTIGKSVTASPAEAEENPRARSARLRIAEKL